jgi:selT/selW/selH-like putative selenoprotein
VVAEVLEAFKNQVDEFRVVPGSGGIFEVTNLDTGEAIFSKAQEKRFPEDGEVARRMGAPLPEAEDSD